MELWAHRGANWHCPENTMEAFRRALQDGATGIELDVLRTKDDEIVVWHDAIWRGKHIRRTRYEGLQGLLRLEEVLAAFPLEKLIVDLKAKDLKLVYLTVDLVRKYNASSRVCLASRSYEVQKWLRDLQYTGERSVSSLILWAIWFLPLVVLQLGNWTNRRVLAPVRWGFFRFDTPYFVRKCQAMGVPLVLWVVNDPLRAKALARLGATGILSDDPASVSSATSPV